MLSDLGTGIQALARGLRLLPQPGIRLYVVVPLLINLILFGALVWYGYSLFAPFVDWMMSHLLFDTPYTDTPYVLLAYDEDGMLDHAAEITSGKLSRWPP